MANDITTRPYEAAAGSISQAILHSQYEALQKTNQVQLGLYFSIGRFVSRNTRRGKWGTGALAAISQLLHQNMPGLRGFSTSSLKMMRTFYEEWEALDTAPDAPYDTVHLQTIQQPKLIESKCVPAEYEEIGNSSAAADELDDKDGDKSLAMANDLQITHRKWDNELLHNTFPLRDFIQVPFSQQYIIITLVKDLPTRLFYIRHCAKEHLSKRALTAAINNCEHLHRGALPNNFFQRLPSEEQARRAVMAFKDEYVLDFINVEQLGARDIEDVDERVVEQQIVHNIRNFIMTFGRDFAFLGNQYRVEALGHTHFIDLLFYNRDLQCLVAVELKTGPFKTAYLGQLNAYLDVLDDFVRKPNENKSVGLLLCRSMDKSYAEYVTRSYDNAMGVATFNTSSDMPERLRKALPDIEDLKRILEQQP